MTKATNDQTQCAIIFDELKDWISQRSRLDFADYGDRLAFGQDARQVANDGKRARAALTEARSLYPARLDVLLDSFRAFSGRLGWLPGFTEGGTGRGKLSYTTGQYWPTEYRKAAASVLETYCSAWRAVEARESPKTFIYATMDDARSANHAVGGHWFEPATMRFFKTKIESRLIPCGENIDGTYIANRGRFITSEKGPDEVRRFTIREIQPDGSIDTIGDFQQFKTREQAKAHVLMNRPEVSK